MIFKLYEVLLPKVNAMTCEVWTPMNFVQKNSVVEANVTWPDLTSCNCWNRSEHMKIFNWLPMGYWKHHIRPNNIVVQKIVFCSLLQLLALSQIYVEIHPVIQTCLFKKSAL